MHTHITVLATTAIALARRIHSHIVQRAEVASYAPDLLLENLVVESRLELSLSCRSSRDIHGCLATAEDHVVLRLRRDSGAVERGIGDIRLEHLERAGVVQLGGLVLRGSDEVRPVRGPLEVGDLHAVVVAEDIVEQLAGLGVPLRDAAVFVAGDDVVAQCGEAGDGDTRELVDDDAERGLAVLLAFGVGVHVVDVDVR